MSTGNARSAQFTGTFQAFASIRAGADFYRGGRGRTWYGWFTEGFDTRDLKEAKVLLEELAAHGDE
jgi:hypothetical protein